MDPKKSLKSKRTFGIIVTILGILAFFVNPLIGVIFIGVGIWFARSIKPEERMATDTRMKKIALPYPMTVQEILEKINGCYFVTGAPYICRTSFVNYTKKLCNLYLKLLEEGTDGSLKMAYSLGGIIIFNLRIQFIKTTNILFYTLFSIINHCTICNN